MKKELTIGLLTVALTIGLASTVTAESQNTDVGVNISDTVQLDVKPDRLEYGQDGDGLVVGGQSTTSDSGYNHIEISNIGSDRLDKIYAQADMPTAQPFGTTSGTNQHNTGNFVVVSLDTVNDEGYSIGGISSRGTDEEFHFLNRVEYYEDNFPTYLSVAEDSDDVNGTTGSLEDEAPHVGRFRVQDASYWFVYYETDGDDVLKVANTPETPTSLGTSDFTEGGDDYTLYEDSEFDDNPDASADLIEGQSLAVPTNSYDGSNPLLDDGGENTDQDSSIDSVREYNLWIDSDQIVRTRFNVEQDSPNDNWTPSTETGGAVDYILDASNTEDDALQPGENFPVDFGVEVPNGVDASSITEGSVTFFAEAFEDTS